MSRTLYGYSPETIEAFGRELEELYERTKAKVGVEDLKIMQDLDRYSRYFDITGRALIHLSPEPVTYLAGIGLLAAHFVMEFTNGHNILHGHYDDIPGAGKIHSQHFRWDNTMDETDWKFEHHVCHHPFTNIAGKDHDYGYLLYRLNPKQEWQPRHLFQMAGLLLMPGIVTSYMPTYISTARALVENRSPLSVDTYGPVVMSVLKTLGRDYLLYPLLAGPLFPKVLIGNIAARLIANTHLMYMLTFEHHGEEVPVVEVPENETKYEFFLRQVITSRNYHVYEWYERLLMGSINTHMEHHLYPDLPFNRLMDVAPEVKAICEKYQVPYRKTSIFEAFGDLMKIAVTNSLPVKPGESALSLLMNPDELAGRILEGARQSWLPLLTGNEQSTFTRTTVVSSRKLSPDVVAITLKNPWPTAVFRPGQYISVNRDALGRKETRQYSITHCTRDTIAIAVRKIEGGRVSPQMHALAAGDTIELVGRIKGEFTLNEADKKLLFIAGGVGLTPVLSMLSSLNADHEAVLLYFNRGAEHVLFRDELDKLVQRGNIRLVYILDTDADGRYSRAQLERHVPDFKGRAIYACAPRVMLDLIEKDLREQSYNFSNYHTEQFVAQQAAKLPKSGKTHKVRFLTSRKETELDENETLLSAIESAGIVIPTGCRAGMCKACTVRLDSGATDKHQKGFQGLLTTCNSYPRSNIDLWV